MKRILIAYDGSPGAEAAVLDLKRAGLPSQAEARVLTIADVWLPPDSEQGGAVFTDVPSQAVGNRTHALEALAAAREISAEGRARVESIFPEWQVSANAVADSPAWGILQEARQWMATLIVAGSHGRSMLQRFFLGSVSAKVVAEAGCSVRIYRPHPEPDAPPHILVGTDGSTDSIAAVDEVASRNWPPGTLIQLVTILDPKLRSAPAALFRDEWQNPQDQGGEWVERMLVHQAERLRKLGLNVETQVFDGDPKDLLLDHAERSKADTIFLGARGLQHGDRLYLGTFASAIATRAPCSVEIVRPTPGVKR